MAIESADDLDIFFDPEEFGESALYTPPGGQAVEIVVIRDYGDATALGGSNRFVMAANHFLIRADKLTPVARAQIDLLDGAGMIDQSFTLQGDPSQPPLSPFWRCPAVPV